MQNPGMIAVITKQTTSDRIIHSSMIFIYLYGPPHTLTVVINEITTIGICSISLGEQQGTIENSNAGTTIQVTEDITLI